MKLHLGCGEKRLPGYVHIDIRPIEGLDYVHDIKNLPMYDNCSVDEIYASHVLDHISRYKIDETLREWNRILKEGGTLRIAVSDFERVVTMYLEGLDLEELWGCIVGGHKDEHDRHGCIFDFATLRRYLEQHGFENIRRYNWRGFLPPDYEDNSCAAIPKYDLDGYPMSLNVLCNKSTNVQKNNRRK